MCVAVPDGVTLVVMMKFDDLRRLEMRGSELSHTDHQHRTDGEVRRNECVTRCEPGSNVIEIVVAEPGRTDNGVDAVRRSECQGLPSNVEDGEVNDDIGSVLGQQLE